MKKKLIPVSSIEKQNKKKKERKISIPKHAYQI